MNISKVWLIFLLTCCSTSMFSCAFDLAHVKYKPAVLTVCSENCLSFVLQEEIALNNLPCGYKRKLKENSEWIMVGSIEAGDVYKPLNQCFTIECSNVFEAYLVMKNDELNGFYLPVEDGYVALGKTIKINRN